jgi:hypothetical protein
MQQVCRSFLNIFATILSIYDFTLLLIIYNNVIDNPQSSASSIETRAIPNLGTGDYIPYKSPTVVDAPVRVA